MAVDIGPRIGIDGEKEFRQELQNINQQLRTLGSEMKAVTSAFDAGDDSEQALAAQTGVLNRQIDAQRQKLTLLQRGLDASAQKYGENDTRTLKWRQAVNEATASLNKMESQLKGTTNEVDDLGDAMDNAGSSAGGLGGLLGDSGLGGILGKGLAVGTIVGSITSITSAMIGLVDETQEYRRIMGTLEISSQNAGYTAEQTTQTYQRLYAVLGDTQTAATATANLQAIGLSQQDLMTVTDAAIGAWARYGDSIPIDSLAESINETIQAGQVTGTFADVLNWAGTSEDDFNAKLEAANSTSERANIVMQELANQGLSQAAQAWYDTNEDIVATNESQAEFEEAQANLAERLVPVKTALTNLASGGFDLLTGAIDSTKDALKSLGEWWDRTQPKLESAWDKFWGIESGSHYGRLSDGSYGWINGSHALGLDYVPFDGYIAQLHQGEMVLTRAQAELLRQQGRMAATPGNDLAEAIRSSAEGTVNSLAAMMPQDAYPREIVLTLENGQQIARWLLPYSRAAARSNPEVAKA